MENIILRGDSIQRGPIEKDLQHYAFLGTDNSGQAYIIPFACKLNFTQAVEKAFSRLHAVNYTINPAEVDNGTESANQ